MFRGFWGKAEIKQAFIKENTKQQNDRNGYAELFALRNGRNYRENKSAGLP